MELPMHKEHSKGSEAAESNTQFKLLRLLYFPLIYKPMSQGNRISLYCAHGHAACEDAIGDHS